MSQDEVNGWIQDMRDYVQAVNRPNGIRTARVSDESVNGLARFFGIKDRSSILFWNKLIDALDEYDPDWRGYPAPKVFRRIIG